MNFLKRTSIEMRRVRWANSKKVWKVFFISLVIIVFFSLVIALFSWGITTAFDNAGANAPASTSNSLNIDDDNQSEKNL